MRLQYRKLIRYREGQRAFSVLEQVARRQRGSQLLKLPNGARAVVEERKITHYLLDPTNPRNQGKPGFFLRFGFTVEEWHIMASALRDHAMTYDVALTEDAEHGVRYTIIGALMTPDGRNPVVRSVWEVRREGDAPRLLTAVPQRRRQ